MLVLLILSACEPSVSFSEPQPKDAPILTSFPSFIQGNYQSENSNATLKINDRDIIINFANDTKMHKKELDSSYFIHGNYMVNKKTKDSVKISISGDTIVQHIVGIDTIFSIGKGNILKKFKGHYFLNTRYNDSTWEVKRLSLEKSILTIAKIELDHIRDLDKLKIIIENPNDTISNRYHPSNKKFKQFESNGGFNGEDKFIKLKK